MLKSCVNAGHSLGGPLVACGDGSIIESREAERSKKRRVGELAIHDLSMSEEKQVCHECGQEADAVFDGVAWCVSCLHIKGSCCSDSEDDAD